jgi:hypothetical protein
LKFSLKKTILAGIITAGLLAASLVAAIPAFAANPSSLTLQSEAVANGATFTVTLSASTTAAAAGGQAYVTFDPSKFTCNSATYNTTTPYFGAGEFNVAGTINNTTGTVNALTSTNGGNPNPAVTGTGTWVTLTFTAKAAANNSVNTISLTSGASFLANSAAQAMPTDVNNGIIVVGTPPQPDLTVSNVSSTLVSGTGTDQTTNPAQYTVSFHVNNSGNLDVTAAFNTSLVINGTATQNFNTTTTLAQGTSETFTSTPIILTGTTDNFVVTADTANTVVESNEANNTASGLFNYTYPSANPTNVNGTLGGTLKFTQPSDVNFGALTLGDNNAWPSMNVVTNQSWTVTIKDGTGNNGFMSKYNGTTNTYIAAVHLANALQLTASGGYLTAPVDPSETAPANAATVTLSNAYQQLANGIPAGQAADGTSGETRTVNFYQKVVGSDEALSSTYSYHSVVSFTCTVGF